MKVRQRPPAIVRALTVPVLPAVLAAAVLTPHLHALGPGPGDSVAATSPQPASSSSSPFLALTVGALAAAGLGAFLLVKRVSREHAPSPITPAAPLEKAGAQPAQSAVSAASARTPPPPVAGRDASVFISYRRDDTADVTGRIFDRLAQHFGRAHVFKDVDSIPFGVDFRVHLQQKVGECKVLLVVIGDRWQGAADTNRLRDAKDYVRIELEAALKRGIPVIPVLVRGAAVPSESDLPETLASLAYRNGIAVRPDPDFHRDMDRLIEGIGELLS